MIIRKIFLLPLLFLLNTHAFSQGIEAVTKDGRHVLLFEDGTWKQVERKKFDIPVGDSYYLGPEDAKVTIMEWLDYQ